jgi:hypothetical protein
MDMPATGTDVIAYLQSVRPTVNSHLVDRLENRNLKWYISLIVEMERHTEDGTATISARFTSVPQVLRHGNEIAEQFDEAIQVVNRRVEEFISMGSGWVIAAIKECRVHTATYNPIGGASYIPSPEWIRKTGGVLNIQNKDNMCFAWSILAHLHPANDHHVERVQKYTPYLDELDFTGIEFPVRVSDLRKFEKQNPTISVNVFALDDKTAIVPRYISKEHERQHTVDLLLI